MPDSVLASAAAGNKMVNQIDPSMPAMTGPQGTTTELGTDTITEIGVARQKLFSIELDRA